jgi:hypothetical protein
MKPGHWVSTILGCFLWLVVLNGCATQGIPPSYIHPNLDLSFYQRVGLLAFSNFSESRFAADRVRELVLSELMLTGLFEILEPGLVDRELLRLGITPNTSLTPEEIQKVGKKLKVQALIVGSVEAYEEHRLGGVLVPEVSIELRMLDVESGQTVWSVAATEGGMQLQTQLLGLRPPTISEATRTLVRRSVDSLLY